MVRHIARCTGEGGAGGAGGARAQHIVRKVLVHGESIGGIVACHVAAACEEVDMLVADRTFGNLAATVVHLWNKALSRLMSWGTGWGKYTNNSKAYLAATCYKVNDARV